MALESQQSHSPTSSRLPWQGVAAQIKLRGVRFETNCDVLHQYCGTFSRFFCSLPASSSNDSGGPDGAATSTNLAALLVAAMPPEAATTTPVREASFDGVKNKWFFDFTVRKDDPNATPEMIANELQPDFAGGIMVHLRKRYAVRDECDKDIAEQKSKLSAKWDEMPRDQQRSMASVVLAFDVTHLRARGYDCPWAAAAEESGEVEDVTVADPNSSTALATQSVELLRAGRGVTGGRKERAAATDHPSATDDTLASADETVACVKCGAIGHASSECKY